MSHDLHKTIVRLRQMADKATSLHDLKTAIDVLVKELDVMDANARHIVKAEKPVPKKHETKPEPKKDEVVHTYHNKI